MIAYRIRLTMIAAKLSKRHQWPTIFLLISVIAQFLMLGAAYERQSKGSIVVSSQLRGLRKLQGGVDKNNNCPNEYSVLRCDDPDLSYEIPCDGTTCEWNLQALDPKSPPDSCLAITINDPLAPDLPDVIRPCALWSLMYGEHKSSPPTTFGTFLSAVIVEFTVRLTHI